MSTTSSYTNYRIARYPNHVFKTAVDSETGLYFSIICRPEYSNGKYTVYTYVTLCGGTAGTTTSTDCSIEATVIVSDGYYGDAYSTDTMTISNDFTGEDIGTTVYNWASITHGSDSHGICPFKVMWSATINGITSSVSYTDYWYNLSGGDSTDVNASLHEPVLVADDNVLGEALNIYWDQGTLGRCYDLTLTIGSYSVTQNYDSTLIDVDTNRLYDEILSDDIAQQFMDDSSIEGTVTLTTYWEGVSNNITLATTSSTFTLSLPSTACPTVDTLTASEGTESGFGYFVQSLSTVLLSVAWTEWQDAQVNTISVYDGTTLLQSNSITEGDTSGTIEVPCSWSGDKVLTVKLTDQRGMVGSEDITVSATAYAVPSATLTYDVDDSTNLLTATVVYAISEVNSENAKTITIVLTKMSDSTTETQTATLTDYSGTYTWTFSMTIESTETYQVEAYVTDSAQDSVHATVKTGIVCISRYAGGKGVTFFGSAKNDGLWYVEDSNYIRLNQSQNFAITEDIVTVTKTAKGSTVPSPYNSSYSYTDIVIDDDAGVGWVEGGIYSFVVNSTMVVASSYRNVRVSIGSGDAVPVCGYSGTILAGSSYFTKAQNVLFVYKTTVISTGALHMLYDANSNTVPAGYCTTAAATAAKTATHTNYILQANSYELVTIYYSNTYAGAITLNINSRGAKPIYINGSASSSSNYTLPAGTYLVFYDGTNYYFRTDGGLTILYNGTAQAIQDLI